MAQENFYEENNYSEKIYSEKNYSEKEMKTLLSQALEEPEVVRMKVNEVYESIRANEKRKTGSVRGRKRRIAGAAAAALAAAVIVATPAAAKAVGLWDDVVAAIFGADEKVQETYEATGLSQTFDTAAPEQQTADEEAQSVQTATVDGMTVSLQQILTDGYQLYLYLDVEAPEGISLDTTNLFDHAELLVDGTPIEEYADSNMSMGASFVEDEYAVADNHRGYEVCFFMSAGVELDGHHLTLALQDFLIDKGKLDLEVAIAGDWTFEWDMSAAYCGKTVSADLSGVKLGEHATLQSIAVTPLSYSLYYDYDGTDMELFDDALWVAFVMKDGTILNDRGDEASNITENEGSYGMTCAREGFSKILDVDEVAGVLIDGVIYPVEY